MEINIRDFFNACNPSHTLVTSNQKDRQYYVDFSEVRGGPIINQLSRTIRFANEGAYTCQLFTGHIGCGKSTELRELERQLREEYGFHVAYCDSMKDLGQGEVDGEHPESEKTFKLLEPHSNSHSAEKEWH